MQTVFWQCVWFTWYKWNVNHFSALIEKNCSHILSSAQFSESNFRALFFGEQTLKRKYSIAKMKIGLKMRWSTFRVFIYCIHNTHFQELYHGNCHHVFLVIFFNEKFESNMGELRSVPFKLCGRFQFDYR